MASIFTFDPDPPRISSPWPAPGRSQLAVRAEAIEIPSPRLDVYRNGRTPPASLLSECGIKRLEPEPQEGPTEYKLHLLLRKRRSLASSSTGSEVSGSAQSRPYIGPPHLTPKPIPSTSTSAAPSTSGSSQLRQNRLQQLTTQLLWRLQQSSPHHSSSLSNLVVPTFPAPAASGSDSARSRPGRLLPGLGESHGALYEIGVSDDGAFVGLTEDEMDESLNTLRAMAASLGCSVRVLRMVVVGECQWRETVVDSSAEEPDQLRNDRLWVAEALVRPDLGGGSSTGRVSVGDLRDAAYESRPPESVTAAIEDRPTIEQLRVTLTGATTSGKSSLLGTLSTATLDNGRGKSRLSLLRHRHELVSGVTSSVAQELFGYQPTLGKTGEAATVINFASGNVSSWMDIHDACGSGRLIFFSDSAGHPRYRRTTARGLVGWAPHWTLLCISATGEDDKVRDFGLGTIPLDQASVDADATGASTAHLKLCLRLGMPLMVIFTKLDRASKSGLRHILTQTLTMLKAAGRKPIVLSAKSRPSDAGIDPDLQSISLRDQDVAEQAVESVSQEEPTVVVPIVLTSAVTGMGIGTLHAVLRNLPIPRPPRPTRSLPEVERLDVVFHIEDIFALPESAVVSNRDEPHRVDGARGAIVSGLLRYGEIAVGDDVLLGPLPKTRAQDRQSTCASPGKSPDVPTFVQAGSRRSCAAFDCRGGTPSVMTDMAYIEVRVISVRNLRLPVRSLLAGQAGTIGFLQSRAECASAGDRDGILIGSVTPGIPGLRKGLILTNERAKPAPYFASFAATFDEVDMVGLAPGILVVVYIASVRAVARIISLEKHNDTASPEADQSSIEGVPQFGGHHLDSTQTSQGKSDVNLHFTTTREWIEVGTQVLIMLAGSVTNLTSDASSGQGRPPGRMNRSAELLEGFVGTITDAYTE